MSNDVNVPVALVLLLAVRPLRVASEDCAGVPVVRTQPLGPAPAPFFARTRTL